MSFYGLGMSYVLDQLPSVQGWALLASSFEIDPLIEAVPATDGYLFQHAYAR